MRLFSLILMLYSLSALAKPCGLAGSIEERIKECAQTKGDFALVAMTDKGVEFYKDLKTGLIWGSRIISDFNHYGSQRACSDEISGYKVLDLKWRLPTIREFEQAYAHGMKAAVSNGDYAYWTSSQVKTRKSRRRRAMPAGAYLWDGFSEKTDIGDLKDGASVRCVAKE
jgi:hypothetical protein